MDTKEAILSTISEFGTMSNDDTSDSNEKVDQNIFIDIKEEKEEGKNGNFDDEITILLRLKEKSLVLFEGLKNIKGTNLEIKLEMVINYLEYQLYVIEDRLKTLQEIARDNDDRNNNDRR